MKALLKTTFLALTLAFSFNAQAQQISFGFKAGAQQANVEAPDFVEDASFVPDFKTITTANFGVVSEIALHPNFAIQPELNYTTKGFKVHENFDVNLFDIPLPLGVTAVSKFNYVEMPLLAKLKLGNELAHFYILGGPTFGYAVSGKLETRARALIEIDLYDTKIDLDEVGYERWEVGGMAGAGIGLQIGSGGQFFVDARYSHGFTQAYDIPVVHDKVQHKSLGVNAGFMIPIGNRRTPRA